MDWVQTWVYQERQSYKFPHSLFKFKFGPAHTFTIPTLCFEVLWKIVYIYINIKKIMAWVNTRKDSVINLTKFMRTFWFSYENLSKYCVFLKISNICCGFNHLQKVFQIPFFLMNSVFLRQSSRILWVYQFSWVGATLSLPVGLCVVWTISHAGQLGGLGRPSKMSQILRLTASKSA